MTAAVLTVASFVVAMVTACAAFDQWGTPWLQHLKIRRHIRAAVRFEAAAAAVRDAANNRLLAERGAW